jgi:hypothetical protein
MADNRHDAATEYAETQSAIAAALTEDAVSRLRASNLDAPTEWPLRLAWWGAPIGLMIETEQGTYCLSPDDPIKPADALRRLFHPGFASPHGGWC